MGQLGFFDADKRLAALSAKGDPLEAIDRLVPWESFRADIEAVVLTPDEMRKSSAGRRPVDAIVMLRLLVLQALHNLSDEQAEYQVRDRLSFTRFLRVAVIDLLVVVVLDLHDLVAGRKGPAESLYFAVAMRATAVAGSSAPTNRSRSQFPACAGRA